MEDEERRPLLDGEPDARRSLRDVLVGSAKPTSLEKLLGGLALAVLCVAAVGWGLFAGEAYKLGDVRRSSPTAPTRTSGPAVPTSTSRPPIRNDEICLTRDCVHMASNLIDSIDYSADPCHDFYQFSTGGWRREHPIPPARGFFGIAQWIDERNARVLHDILSSPSSEFADSPEDKANVRLLKDFFDSCADEDTLDRVGAAPLLDIVNATLAGWSSSIDGNEEATIAKSDRARLATTLSSLHKLGVRALFGNEIEGDVVENPDFLRIWLAQSGLGLPSRSYYSDEEALQVYSEVVAKALGSVYGALPELGKAKAGVLAGKVVELETKMASISVSEEELEDPAGTYHLATIDELDELFPLVDWTKYYHAFSPRPYFPNPLVVKTPKYLEELSTLLQNTTSGTMKAYLIWHVVQDFAPLLGSSQPTRKAVARLESYLSGTTEGVKPDRAEVCLTSVLDNFGILAGRYFVMRTFTGKSKAYAEDIIAAVIGAFKDRLDTLDWIDPNSRELAKEKADAIKIKIGFPASPDTEDPKALQKYYASSLPVNKTDYFGNVLRSRKADVKRLFKKVGAKRDTGEWDMIPSEVNAYYEPSSNSIAFPAGILQAPYYSADWPEALAFGAFGSVAGHELTHAFDNAGRQYDRDGRLQSWWTNDTIERFDNLTHCFLNQYGNYTMTSPAGKEVHLNPRLTLGEDMADAGGVAQAFRAWKDRFESDPEGKRYRNFMLPGLEFTREQLFWLGYGRGWARNLEASEAIKRIYTDPHSATKFRVIGPLSNDENFLAAWGCKKKDAMDRRHKCRIW